MPTAALHSHYWADQTQADPPATGASANGGYVPWQMVVVGSGFGALQVVWERYAALTRTTTGGNSGDSK